MKIKKISAFLLCAAMVFAAGCKPSESGGGTSAEQGGSSAPTDAPPTDAPPTETTAKQEKPPVTVEAKDFNFVVLKFNAREFTTKPGKDASIMLGDNITLNGAGKKPNNNTASDAIIAAFQQPFLDDPNFANRFIITQNPDFWNSVDSITASFYLDQIDKDAEPTDIGCIQEYIQMGGKSKTDAWKFVSDEVNLLEQFPDGYVYGAECVFTVTWDIKGMMSEYGTDEIANPDDEEGKGGGVLKFGIQVCGTDECIDPRKLKVNWTDVEIFVKDKAKFDEYVAKVSEITGETMPADAKITEVG